MFFKNKEAQVWIETVLYTLIGLAVIGLLLAATKPKISSTKDEFIIQQTINALNELDSKISEIKQAAGNSRIIEFQLSRGELEISSSENAISWTLEDSSYKLSEENFPVKIGDITALTQKSGDNFNILLLLNYTGVNNLTIDSQQKELTLPPAKTPYNILIENTGNVSSSGELVIDFSIS